MQISYRVMAAEQQWSLMEGSASSYASDRVRTTPPRRPVFSSMQCSGSASQSIGSPAHNPSSKRHASLPCPQARVQADEALSKSIRQMRMEVVPRNLPLITRCHPLSSSTHASNFPGSVCAASTNAGGCGPPPPCSLRQPYRLSTQPYDVLTTPLSNPQHASHATPPATPSCSRSGKTIRLRPHGTGTRRPISPPFVAAACTSCLRFRYLVLTHTHATCCGRHWQT